MNTTRPSTKNDALHQVLKASRVVVSLPSRFWEQVWRRICGGRKQEKTFESVDKKQENP